MTMLDRENFNDYIWFCFFDFVDRKGAYADCTDDFFHAKQAVNRNPEQVPCKLWAMLITRHINRYNYN